jgi:hypothetical protein
MVQRYQQKAGLNAGKESGWIDGWLSQFVEDVGLETVQRLLPEYTIVPSTGSFDESGLLSNDEE